MEVDKGPTKAIPTNFQLVSLYHFIDTLPNAKLKEYRAFSINICHIPNLITVCEGGSFPK